MKIGTKRIEKERYNEIVKMDQTDANNAMMDEAPIDWLYGYGIYGCRPVERDGEFMIEYTIGDFCD